MMSRQNCDNAQRTVSFLTIILATYQQELPYQHSPNQPHLSDSRNQLSYPPTFLRSPGVIVYPHETFAVR
jgi:hypothetical protein